MNKMNNLLKRAAITAAMMAVAVTLPARADHSDSGVELSADGTVVNLECVTFGGLEYTLREYVYFTNEDKDRPALEGKLSLFREWRKAPSNWPRLFVTVKPAQMQVTHRVARGRITSNKQFPVRRPVK